MCGSLQQIFSLLMFAIGAFGPFPLPAFLPLGLATSFCQRGELRKHCLSTLHDRCGHSVGRTLEEDTSVIGVPTFVNLVVGISGHRLPMVLGLFLFCRE